MAKKAKRGVIFSARRSLRGGYMKLGTINRVLRCFGLVLVVQYDDEGVQPMRLWLELARHYDARCR